MNIYFRLIFGLVKTGNTSLRLKFVLWWEGDFLCKSKSESDLLLHFRNQVVKTEFLTFVEECCEKLWCIQKLVLNNLLLKISGKQNHLKVYRAKIINQ